MNYFHNIAKHLSTPEGQLLKYLKAGAISCGNSDLLEFGEQNIDEAMRAADYAMQTCPAKGGQLIAGLVYVELLIMHETKSIVEKKKESHSDEKKDSGNSGKNKGK